ncbi:MAG: hypothetical protein H7199_05590 [Burkholderiales bacterium]|nr:hypothetical protein [Flavobacterium sp.]
MDPFFADHVTAFRTCNHVALDGLMSGLILALPVTGTNAMNERKSFRYTFVRSILDCLFYDYGWYYLCLAINGKFNQTVW